MNPTENPTHPRMDREQEMRETTQQLVTRAFITPECRENRGVGGAWEEAVRRLRVEYDAIVEGWKGEGEQPTLALMLFYERPIPDDTAPVIPPLFCGSAPTQPDPNSSLVEEES